MAKLQTSQAGGDQVALGQEKRAAWRRRGVKLASYVSAQVVVQALSLSAGLLLVRTLSPREFALFMIATTMQNTMNVLSNLGVSSTLSAIGGSVWQDRQRLGQAIQTGLEFRRWLCLSAAIVVCPIAWWMLRSNGASTLYAALVVLVLTGGFYFQASLELLSVVPRLHSRLVHLQRIDLMAAALRFSVVVTCLCLANAMVAVAAASLSFWLQSFLLAKQAKVDADFQEQPNAQDRAVIWKAVKQQTPSCIYYCLQSQLTILLISHFGNTQNIAELGALGRLAVLFTITSTVLTNIVAPRFARCQEASRLRVMYFQVVSFYLALSGGFVGLAIAFPGPMLWLLGPQYAHLGRELAFVAVAAVCGTIAAVLYTLNASRAWMQGIWVSIPITLASQAILAPFLDLGSVQGVAILSGLPTLLGIAPFLYRASQEMQKMAVAQQRTSDLASTL